MILQALIAPAITGILAAIREDGLPDRAPHVLAVLLGVALNCLVAYYAGPNPNYAQAVLIGIPLGMSAAAMRPTTQQVVAYVKTAGSTTKTAAAKRPHVTVMAPIKITKRDVPPTP